MPMSSRGDRFIHRTSESKPDSEPDPDSDSDPEPVTIKDESSSQAQNISDANSPLKNPDSADEEHIESFECPNCHFDLTPDDVGVIIFEEATVYHCPICKKTMALMPRFPAKKLADTDERD